MTNEISEVDETAIKGGKRPGRSMTLSRAILLAALVAVGGCDNATSGDVVHSCVALCADHGGVGKLFHNNECNCNDGLWATQYPRVEPNQEKRR